MKRTIYAKHEPYQNGHLGEVAREMELAGTPTIRCVERNGQLYALEGSHRLAAAFAAGHEPKIVLLIPDADESLDSFWNRVAPDLPRYDFDHIHLLDLREFILGD